MAYANARCPGNSFVRCRHCCAYAGLWGRQLLSCWCCPAPEPHNCTYALTWLQAQRRTSAFAHTVLRLGLSPVLVLIWLADLPNRIVYSEPEYYGRCRFQEPWAEGMTASPSAHFEV